MATRVDLDEWKIFNFSSWSRSEDHKGFIGRRKSDNKKEIAHTNSKGKRQMKVILQQEALEDDISVER